MEMQFHYAEIDADRANYSDEPQRKPSKKPGRGGVHQWTTNHRGGHRGGQRSRGGGSGRSEDGTPKVPKGGRLEGRVSVNHESGGAHKSRGRGGRHQSDRSNNATAQKTDNKNEEKAPPPKHQRNMRRSAKIPINTDDFAAQKSPAKNKNRKHYTNKHEIKQLLRALVNRVEKAERMEKQKLKQQQQQQQQKDDVDVDSKKAPEGKETSPLQKEEPKGTESVPSEPAAAEAPQVEASPAEASPPKEASPPAEASAPKEASPPEAPAGTEPSTVTAEAADANQNVIKLIEEKVLQIQMS
ncbi:unnamed protein product [Nippostrongylus brasiliensis]|uniref:Nuclear fragile X mental retardation-interacting protein 1 n=1 Tax=Nippostrongylus brasiliensis TaxID=27835 RepID=A0A158R0U5_NIPBR|nr:unnamed protein product [Nippostrongylus brasiliensis]